MPAREGVALMTQIMDEVEDEYSGFARHFNFTERMAVRCLELTTTALPDGCQ